MKDPLLPFVPSAADPFDLAKVGHLLRRAGFGAPLAVRQRLARDGVDAAFAWLDGAGADTAAHARAAARWLDAAIAFGQSERVRAFRVWLASTSPLQLQQRVSYFWHGHFATGDQKLGDPRAMALQLATFDRLGRGTSDALFGAMCRDPALLRWLDNDVNTAARPNENFARELFELFALGRGHYTEGDVRAAARCFTGWHVHAGRFRFARHLHDDGDKELFGARGRFDGDDVLARTLPRRASAEFLAERWLRWFVHPEPQPDEVAALADVYVATARDVGATLAALLRSRLFFSPRAWRSKVKSPADFVVGTVRLLDARAAPAELARAMAALGETWLEPPSVEGWHGERAWLSDAAWLLRSNFVADLLARRHGKLAPAPGVSFAGLRSPAHVAHAAALVLLDGAIEPDDRERLEAVAAAQYADDERRAAAVLHAAACLPDYQLS